MSHLSRQGARYRKQGTMFAVRRLVVAFVAVTALFSVIVAPAAVAGTVSAAQEVAMAVAAPAHTENQAQGDAQVRAQIACPSGRICLYEHNNYGGRIAYYATGSSDMSRYGPSFNDKTSSIINNSGYRWCLYQHANYKGAGLIMNPWTYYASLGGWNDIISSLRRC